MKKKNRQTIFEKLRLPLIALAVIAVIYVGLVMRNLTQQVDDLKKQNETISFNAAELSVKIDQLQNETNTVKSKNDSLAADLVAAQNQISSLQNTSGIKKVSGASTYKPAVATKVVTQTVTETVTKEVEKNQATVTIQGIGSYKVDLQVGDNSFTVLKRAAAENNFALNYEDYGFGVFVTNIGNTAMNANNFWAFYFNGTFSEVGATDQPVVKGDSIFWQLSTF